MPRTLAVGLIILIVALAPQAAGTQNASVVHIKVVLIDAAKTATPVPRHTLLISDNPASAPPRQVVTSVDGTAEVRLRPGNYTVESDRPITFHGKTYEWRQTIDVVAGRETTLELTADNAEIGTATTAAATTAGGNPRPLEADPAFLLPKWQASVLAIWTPTNRASGFVVDAAGLVVTNQRLIGGETSVEVQPAPAVKVVGQVLAADQARDVAVIWINPKVIASVAPLPLACSEASKLTVSMDEELFAIAAPMRGPKTMTSGTVGRIDSAAIFTDAPLPPGSPGGPVFKAPGDLVGITSVVDDERDGAARDSRLNARVVRAADVCEVLSAAQQKLKTGAAPPAETALPVEPATPFPVDALREGAKRGTESLTAYQVSSSSFDVTFITPPLTYAAQYPSAQKRTTSRDTRKPEPEQDLVRPLIDFSNWTDYVSDFPPVLLVRVTPRLTEGFWTMMARGAARTQGVSIPPIKRIKSGFGRLRAFCGDSEVTPIHPFKLAQQFPGHDDVVYEGLYVFAPDALRPDCASVKLVLYSEKEPDKGETKVIEPAIVERAWQDFAPYRAISR
jgi:S1-C subfamily serine protease